MIIANGIQRTRKQMPPRAFSQLEIFISVMQWYYRANSWTHQDFLFCSHRTQKTTPANVQRRRIVKFSAKRYRPPVMYLWAMEAMSSMALPSRSLSSIDEAISNIVLPDDACCG